MKKFKIISNTGFGYDTRVFFVDDDGKETEIGGALRSVKISLRQDSINIAKIVMEGFVDFDGKVEGELKIIHKEIEGAQNGNQI